MTHGPTDPSVIAFLSYKRNKNLVPHALLSYISTWEFLRTLEKCEKINSQVLIELNNAHSAFLISLR